MTNLKLGIMQPYFFPYIGYYSLIRNTDEFILLDTVQFIKHGWIERNRVLKPNGEGADQYIMVPLEKHSQKTLIQNVKIKNDTDWRRKMMAQLVHYKRRAPFYKETMEVVENAIAIDTDDITRLDKSSLQCVCEYLGIPFKCRIFSEMNLEIDPVTAPDEWALNICRALGYVSEYWNPEGGRNFFDRGKYIDAGIELKFIRNRLPVYSQRTGHEFVPALSIIDVMMFNSPDRIREMLDDYEFVN